MKDITIIHHSADYDGIFCRKIANKFCPNAKLIGWDFADKPLDLPQTDLIVMDLPLDKPFGFDFTIEFSDTLWLDRDILIWIDHHQSAIKTHPEKIPGYRIDGVAACRLAWQWFNNNTPSKEEFVERTVSEPLAIRLAGEYDIWDKRDPRAETFQYALRSCVPQWNKLLDKEASTELVDEMLFGGQFSQNYAQRENESIIKHKSFLIEWEGLKFLTINNARYNSLLFAAKDVPETGHDALMGFGFNGKIWIVSLYHAKHRTDLDLSTIAVKYGGGGHKGACGFTTTKLPFLQ